MDHMNRGLAIIELDEILGHAFRDSDDRAVADQAVRSVFQGSGNRVEDRLAESNPSLQLAESKVPGAIADMAGEHVAAESAESLRMDLI